MRIVTFVMAALIISMAAFAARAENRMAAMEGHLAAIEGAPSKDIESVVQDFERNRFSPAFKAGTTPDTRRELLEQIRQAAADAQGADISETDSAIVLTLMASEQAYDVTLDVEEGAPYRITRLDVSRAQARPPAMALSLETLPDQLRQLEEKGLSGVVSVKIDGEIVHQAGYGFADMANARKNRLDTVFGIGSRPIDFTVASIYLLEQQGRLDLEDSIAKHFDGVPADKRAMTIRHLITGQSGLPDFPAKPGDWDADLAWIDREELERRTMQEPLLFAPGQGRKHSHWAFGVAAAIIERVSGESYYEFIREHFFDPAGMQRTGEQGERRNLSVIDFAVGGGPSFVGLPNIPPNWGPTSWLVKGSGGMYSTIGDLIQFYEFIRSGDVLEPEYVEHFTAPTSNSDGSLRGFELFSTWDEGGSDEAFLVVNTPGGPGGLFGDLARALEQLIAEH